MTPQSEHHEQAALFRWAEYAAGRWPELGLLHAIPNGGHRSKITAAMLKAEGVRPGVPDICLPVPRHDWHGLYIELKTPRGRPSKEQQRWIAALNRQGYRADVCHGWEQARAVIELYLGARWRPVRPATPNRNMTVTYPPPVPERLGPI